MSPMLSVCGVTKRFGRIRALSAVDLRVEPGEIVGLIGPNGAGKSTFVYLAAGLLAADEGSIRIDGVDPRADARRARALLGVAPQSLGVYPNVSTRANLEFFAAIHRVPARRRRQRVDEVAEAFGLVELLARPVAELSGGQQRRLHTAAALLHRPQLVLLDEPTVGVDVERRTKLLELVRNLATEDGVAVVYTTHYLEELERLNARVSFLVDGRIALSGSIRDLIDRSASSEVDLVFDGPIDPTSTGGRLVDGCSDRLRLRGPEPGVLIADALERLGPGVRLRDVRVATRGLEDVYLELLEGQPSTSIESSAPSAGAPSAGSDARTPPFQRLEVHP